MMDWRLLLSTQRLGAGIKDITPADEDRSQFQRDYDRIIFSAAFRRMQNKTQVFPLPGRIFVHNRLTHTLEVASVGRSLGNRLSEMLFHRGELTDPGMLNAIGSVVSAACLAHDMGNPPFGHSGESAISHFFAQGAGKSLLSDLDEAQVKDFTCFDGNANAFRLLTHGFHGKRAGGFALTYTTLASIVKYPFESLAATRQKLGFFQSEKDTWLTISSRLGIPVVSENPLIFSRHPLVYLVEAADDICYQLMDVEDAFRLGILDYRETYELLMGFHDGSGPEVHGYIRKTLEQVKDPNEQVSYLRAGIIGKLTSACFDVFAAGYDDIMEGKFSGSLLSNIAPDLKAAMKKVQELSVSRIYNHRTVVEIEIAGYRIIGTLLEEFCNAILHPDSPVSEKVLMLLPMQYQPSDSSVYAKIQSVTDFISGMTDVYALDLYRKLKGISLPEIV
jgi:dGTPase